MLHPIDVSENFFKRFEALHDIFKARNPYLVKFKIGGIGLKAKIGGTPHSHDTVDKGRNNTT